MKNKKNLLVILLLVALAVLAIPGVSEATGEMLSEKDSVKDFISLNTNSVFFLFILGFLAGVLSGFIGSGGAFVLTPGMMALGVPAAVAVATNMCHKFPKALVGAYKRFKYGQVDIKLGLINGISACVGVQIGIQIQKIIMAKWGAAGSNLYVSLVFVGVLTVLGIYVLSDARKSMRSNTEGSVSSLAERIKKINIPPMIYFKTANVRISFWVTVPVGLATGLLAATIAVGGFVGVPGMVYVMGVPAIVASASELIIAFTMGLSGSFTWALSGFIDIRMVVIIMAGSLIGVQIGAVGTTYVKDYMIKYVMSSVMLIVAVSRSFAIPPYLQDLGFMHMAESTVNLLKNVSFVLLCLALAAGGLIILGSMFKKRREIKAAEQAQVMQHS